MKKELKLAGIYVMFLLLGTVLGTLLYSLYLNLLGFVAGQEITFFSDSELFTSFFFVLFCMLFFMPALICYYRIRHPGGFLQLLVYVLLCALTWVLLVPCTAKLQDYCKKRFSFDTQTSYLTPNYFRQVDDTVYYFTRDFESVDGRVAEAPAVIISTAESGTVEFETVRNYDNLEVNRKALPYREIQLKNIFGSDKNPIPVDFNLLIKKVTTSYSGGLRSLLTLLSFVLLLASVYAITSFFDWRLLTSVILFITTVFILCFNSVYFLPAYDSLKFQLTNNGFFRAFDRIVDEPLLFICNCFGALVLITAGVIKMAVRKHAAKVK